ncbi:hypothetical protein D3C87_1615940 [compost metagenome]
MSEPDGFEEQRLPTVHGGARRDGHVVDRVESHVRPHDVHAICFLPGVLGDELATPDEDVSLELIACLPRSVVEAEGVLISRGRRR